MAAGAVDPVELELLAVGGPGHEALELGGAHALHVHEVHVVCDHGRDHFDGGVGIAQSPHDLLGHLGTDAVVTVEADALGLLIVGGGGGLADVVQQDREAEFKGGIGREESKGDEGVDVNVTLGMPFGRLLAAAQFEKLRDDEFHETEIDEEFDAAPAVGMSDDAVKLVTNALCADGLEERRVLLDGRLGGGIDFEARPDREAHCTQQAEGVFLKTL